MTKIFVWGDILTLNVQSTGAGLVAQDGHEELGEYIVVEGLILQLIVFGFFVVAAGVWHVRMRGYGEKMGEVEVGRHVNVPWRQGLRMLYVCCALIVVRSVFRVVEYAMGRRGICWLMSGRGMCLMRCLCWLCRWCFLFGFRISFGLTGVVVRMMDMC